MRNSGPFFLMKGESSNNMLWKAVNYNAMGQITQSVLGNSIVTNKGMMRIQEELPELILH